MCLTLVLSTKGTARRCSAGRNARGKQQVAKTSDGGTSGKRLGRRLGRGGGQLAREVGVLCNLTMGGGCWGERENAAEMYCKKYLSRRCSSNNKGIYRQAYRAGKSFIAAEATCFSSVN